MSALSDQPLQLSPVLHGGFFASLFGSPTSQRKLFWGVTLLACLPFLIPYMRTLWRQELYQYFPFVLLGVGYLAFARWNRHWHFIRGRWGWFLATLGGVFLACGALLASSWLGSVGFLLLATSFLFSHSSISGGSLGYLALPLIMFVRIPQLHAQSLVSRLQKITSQLASLYLDLLGVPQDTFANAIKLPTKNLFVAEACSGIQSAFTMCFLALLVLVWKKRPLIVAPLYVAIALGLAIVANIFRVVVISLAEAWYQYDLTSGLLHDMIGYISLLVAAGLLFSFDVFAGLLLHPVDIGEGKFGANPLAIAWNYSLGFKSADYSDEEFTWNEFAGTRENAVQEENPEPLSAQEGIRWSTAALLGVTILSGFFMLGGVAFGRTDSRPVTSKEALLFDPPNDFLPGQVGVLTVGKHELMRDGDDPQLGRHADVWTCGNTNVVGQIVMSQPFVGWHELCVCYEVQEWNLEERYNLKVDSGKPIAVGYFTKEQDQKGYLFFTAIDSDGAIPTPPSYTLFGRLLAPFIPLITDDYAETSGSAQTIMLQFWTMPDRELTPAEINEIANSLVVVRDQTSSSVRQLLESDS